MTGRGRRALRAALLGAVLAAATAVLPSRGALAQQAPPPPASARILAQDRDGLSVRVAVLTGAESQAVFGVPVDRRGIQPVWIEATNRTAEDRLFLPIATDATAYSPTEVSWRFRDRLDPAAQAAQDARFAASRMPFRVPAGGTASGYVFTHLETGLKFVTVVLATGRDETAFRFIVPVPGPPLAVERVDFATLWPASSLRDVDLPALREALAALPCCATNAAGDRPGDPLNLVVVGDGLDSVFPFVDRGWRFTQPLDLRSGARATEAFLFGLADPSMPVSPLWVYGRREDLALQKPRNSISERNHLRLWLTPLRHQGRSVFVGQISRDIGVEFTDRSWYLTTHKIDPLVDLDRDYLLQDLVMSGAVASYGFVTGVGPSPASSPRTNLTGDPYMTDGLRLVLVLGPPRNRFVPVGSLGWENPPAGAPAP